MSMRELLRIEMSEAQVREACEAWVRERASREILADVTVLMKPSPGGAIVVLTKQRARRSSKQKARVGDGLFVGVSKMQFHHE